ncbi:ferric reductase NAD binding domain-containing protein [Dichomitus squalens]|nr:ferric reductase NAD binding domain-containing protein [Dichomitus squalens]
MSINASPSLNASAPAAVSHPGSAGSAAPGGPGGPMVHAPNPDRALRIARNHAYAHQIWWLIASFIALIIIFQFLSWAVSKYYSRNTPKGKKPADAEAGASPIPSPRRFSLRNIPTAIINVYRVVAFRWTLEIGQSYTLNFAEVFITVAYIVALFTWEFVNTTDTQGQKLDISYWGSRAGSLAVTQTPLITALGTKNNVISYITGISYDKLNYIHRMTARVVFVLLWVHGGAKLSHSVPEEFDEWFIRIGLTAIIAFSILILVSLRPIRAEAYEVFYFTHFFMVLYVIFLLGGYFHAKKVDFATYVWPSFLIWALDRFIRVARVVYYNHLYFGFSSKSDRLDASVELLSPHFVRLHISRPPHFNWTPGQTAFLVMPTVSGNPLEAHPFTIASVDSHYQLTTAEKPDLEKKASSDAVDIAPYWKELVFLINVREGFTKRLAAIAQKGEKVKVLIDGPYGFSPNLDNDDTVVLVAGGSGVTFTLSTFLGVLSHVQNKKSKCRRIVWVWTIREADHIEWVSKALSKALELAPSDLEISIRIYVTGRSASNETALRQVKSWNEDDSIHSSEGTTVGKSRPPSLLNFPAVQVNQGRPDIPALLHDEVDATTGRISVTVCGSQGIARACRKALRVPISTGLNGGPSVVLHVESFGYA